MGKWVTGGANVLTLLRVPCMLLVLYAVFGRGHNDLFWYWIGVFALAVGMLLDAADGQYARRVQRGGPTREGKFLDQFIDKWGFVYPIFGAMILACYDALPWHFFAGVGVILVLDAVSCFRHYRDYRFTVQLRLNRVDKFGAVDFGKWKFLLQNFVICAFVASRFPVGVGGTSVDAPWWLTATKALAVVGSSAVPVSYAALWVAIILACFSLRKRAEIRQEVEREVEAQPI